MIEERVKYNVDHMKGRWVDELGRGIGKNGTISYSRQRLKGRNDQEMSGQGITRPLWILSVE